MCRHLAHVYFSVCGDFKVDMARGAVRWSCAHARRHPAEGQRRAPLCVRSRPCRILSSMPVDSATAYVGNGIALEADVRDGEPKVERDLTAGNSCGAGGLGNEARSTASSTRCLLAYELIVQTELVSRHLPLVTVLTALPKRGRRCLGTSAGEREWGNRPNPYLQPQRALAQPAGHLGHLRSAQRSVTRFPRTIRS